MRKVLGKPRCHNRENFLSKTITTTKTRLFNLTKFFLRVFSKPRHPGKFHRINGSFFICFCLLFFSQEKLVRLGLLKEVKPSCDRKIIKLLTSDNLFSPLRNTPAGPFIN